VPVADVGQFEAFNTPGYAKAAVDFRVLLEGDGCRVSTETRVFCTSPEALHAFKRYWLMVKWGSGAIRRSWLQAIKRRALRET
jgi:hypothetical protein